MKVPPLFGTNVQSQNEFQLQPNSLFARIFPGQARGVTFRPPPAKVLIYKEVDEYYQIYDLQTMSPKFWSTKKISPELWPTKNFMNTVMQGYKIDTEINRAII